MNQDQHDSPVVPIEDSQQNDIETDSPRSFNLWPYLQTAVRQLRDQGVAQRAEHSDVHDQEEPQVMEEDIHGGLIDLQTEALTEKMVESQSRTVNS